MIGSKHQRMPAMAANWMARIATFALITLTTVPSNAVETLQAANNRMNRGLIATPRTAQRASSYSNQFSGPSSESLPIPNPDTLQQAKPKQHFIPFAKSDPDANVVVKDDEGLISLVVREASLRQVVAMVAETQKLNIVFAAPADIGITASFDRIPWQQALDSLLIATGHTWTNSKGIIYICSLETADLMPPGIGGRQTRIFELDFASAVDIDLAIKGLLSPAGQSWIQESSSDDNRRSREVIVVYDSPAHIERIAQYVFQIDQPPRQVLIEAHILQVDLEEDCKNGVNFDAIASFHGNELNFKTVGFANPAATSAFFLEVTGSALNGLVELLQTTTDAKTLASPRLLVISGQQARIQIGEQLGYRVTTTTQTSSLESVEFLDVGVVLSVTPRITRDGRVMMRIKPEISTGNVSPLTGLPEEETTEVETDILLSDGQGMVIGGLIQEQDDILTSKIPYIGDLPYIGVLFQKRQSIKSRSEIIVTLIPRIQPYSPVVADREAHALMRTEEPLTTGALNRAYRPYEPRLYDALTNPRPICIARHCAPVSTGTEVIIEPSFLTPLPSVDEDLTCLPKVIRQPSLVLPQLQSDVHSIEIDQ